MGSKKSGMINALRKGIRITRNSRILIGIHAHAFKVRSDKKAVCILECLGVRVQKQSWWVLRYN